jgi:predicted O-methyltransferase YrrM
MEFLPVPIQEYAERFTSPEPAPLRHLNQETWQKVLSPRMLSGHLQGRILSMFSHMMRPSRVLEVGTYTGYSAICFAEGLAPGGKVITLEVNAELEPMARQYFHEAGQAANIELLIGDAREIIPGLTDTFDLVFLDADKENYTTYYKLILPKMRSGGLLLADNVLWSGRVMDENVHDEETEGLRDFVNFVSHDATVEQLLLPVRDGIMMVRKK